jgi:hypothetical protein
MAQYEDERYSLINLQSNENRAWRVFIEYQINAAGPFAGYSLTNIWRAFWGAFRQRKRRSLEKARNLVKFHHAALLILTGHPKDINTIGGAWELPNRNPLTCSKTYFANSQEDGSPMPIALVGLFGRIDRWKYNSQHVYREAGLLYASLNDINLCGMCHAPAGPLITIFANDLKPKKRLPSTTG